MSRYGFHQHQSGATLAAPRNRAAADIPPRPALAVVAAVRRLHTACKRAPVGPLWEGYAAELSPARHQSERARGLMPMIRSGARVPSPSSSSRTAQESFLERSRTAHSMLMSE